jgi:hypothetical protein
MGVVTADASASAATALREPWLPQPWRSALVLALFATLLATVGPRHEPWFDEAQAWLIGRDTTLWELLAHRVRYEGTPGLWHAILWLASHAGLPYAYLWLISSVLACLGAWIILTRAPFPYWLRVGIVFSYFLAYQYAIVARSYALDLVLIPLIAVNFADRLRRPVVYGLLLGLTANANVYSFLFAGILLAEFLLAALREGREQAWRSALRSWQWQFWRWPRVQLAGIAVYAACAAAAVLQAWPTSDANYLAMVYATSARGTQMFVEAFVNRLDIWSSARPSEWSMRAGVVITTVLLAPSVVLFRQARIALLAAAIFVSLVGFAGMKYASAWHAGILYLCWIFALWIGWSALSELSAARRRVTVASIATIVFVNVYYTATTSLRDVREPYSAAPAAVQVLTTGDAHIAAVGFKTFAVQPWFTANAFRNYHGGAAGEAYYTWKRGEDFLPYVAYDQWRRTTQDARYNALLLSTHEVEPEDRPRLLAAARGAGYCGPTELPGGLIWKSYIIESEELLVFWRCPDGLAQARTEQKTAPTAR